MKLQNSNQIPVISSARYLANQEIQGLNKDPGNIHIVLKNIPEASLRQQGYPGKWITQPTKIRPHYPKPSEIWHQVPWLQFIFISRRQIWESILETPTTLWGIWEAIPWADRDLSNSNHPKFSKTKDAKSSTKEICHLYFQGWFNLEKRFCRRHCE